MNNQDVLIIEAASILNEGVKDAIISAGKNFVKLMKIVGHAILSGIARVRALIQKAKNFFLKGRKNDERMLRIIKRLAARGDKRAAENAKLKKDNERLNKQVKDLEDSEDASHKTLRAISSRQTDIIEGKNKEIERLEERIKQLNDDLSRSSNDSHELREELIKTRSELRDAKADLKKTSDELFSTKVDRNVEKGKTAKLLDAIKNAKVTASNLFVSDEDTGSVTIAGVGKFYLYVKDVVDTFDRISSKIIDHEEGTDDDKPGRIARAGLKISLIGATGKRDAFDDTKIDDIDGYVKKYSEACDKTSQVPLSLVLTNFSNVSIMFKDINSGALDKYAKQVKDAMAAINRLDFKTVTDEVDKYANSSPEGSNMAKRFSNREELSKNFAEGQKNLNKLAKSITELFTVYAKCHSTIIKDVANARKVRDKIMSSMYIEDLNPSYG